MSDDIIAGTSAPESQSVQLVVDEKDIKSVFANAYRIYTTSEEVVIDLGFNMPDPNPAGGGGPRLLFKVTDRVIMSYASTKRLALSIGQLVKRYEQQYGEIPVRPGQPSAKA